MLAFVLLKLLVLDIVKVNNKDMRATYEYGDALLLKKTFNSYRTNNILYFKYPVKDSSLPDQFFFQRLIGLPGDTICLRGKTLFINSILIQDTGTLKNNYFIETKGRTLDSAFKAKYQLTEGGQVSNKFDYSFSLTKTQSILLQQDTLIKKLELKSEKVNNFDETCFPYSAYYKWNMDHYGKIYIPKKHDTLALDSISLPLYATLIQAYENNTLEVRHDSILINGQLSRYYVPQQNYYFVLGDNRDNANDSRIWGFLPEDHIIGKAIGRITKGKP